jgi:hydroxyquinol 1,2-dioxygenase
MIKSQDDLTQAVLAELSRAANPRFREIMSLAVLHLHAFVREAKLTEPEFHQACAVIASLGQASHASHNEVVLAAGSLGISSLVCLQNNSNPGQEGTTANLLGPFWRSEAPWMEHGASLVRSQPSIDTAIPLWVRAQVSNLHGEPLSDVEVDVWHSSNEGYYENQDPSQADMNLRGRFKTDAKGMIHFRTIKPLGYPIPVNGPVGALLRAQGRHNMRPAHLHFLLVKEGYKTQFAQVYASDDPNLETDVQFAVTERLVGEFVEHHGQHPTAPEVTGRWYSLDFNFVIQPGLSTLPKPPITGKSTSPRPPLEILTRSAPACDYD